MARKKKLKKQPTVQTSKPTTSHLPKVKRVPKNKPATKRGSWPVSSNGMSSQKWIVEDLETENFVLNPSVSTKVSKLSSFWKNGKKISESTFEVDPSPFKHCMIKQLLKDEAHLNDVCRELLRLPHEPMLNDLYSCHQACLLNVGNEYPYLRSIVKLIKGPLRSLVQEITGRKFSDKFTITASQYKFTDRLLCHDDNLHDRSVAFIFYLCKDWKPVFGGSLDLFTCDPDNQPLRVVKSIFPSFGSFAFFEVSHNSYHQVSEVLSSKSVRLSINGWYHGEDLPQQTVWHSSLPKMLTPIQPRGCSLDDYINSTWLDPKIHAQMKSSFEQELSISLSKFLQPPVFEEIKKAIMDDQIVWESCGPANQRRYQTAKQGSLPNFISQYLKVMQSKQWFRFLSQCTVEISPDVKPTPKCWFEVQKWQPGDYTVLVDDDPLNNTTGIDVHLYFGVEKGKQNNGGEIFYLGPDRDEQGNLEQAFHLEPENNMAVIVAHIEGMAVLTKYLDHRNSPFYKIYARYSQSFD